MAHKIVDGTQAERKYVGVMRRNQQRLRRTRRAFEEALATEIPEEKEKLLKRAKELALDASTKAKNDHRALHSFLSRAIKVVDRTFDRTIVELATADAEVWADRLYRRGKTGEKAAGGEREALLLLCADHLYRLGRYDVAEGIASKYGGSLSHLRPLRRIHDIASQITKGVVHEALEWCKGHDDAEDLVLELHCARLCALILRAGRESDPLLAPRSAIAYVKQFALPTKSPLVRQLLGAAVASYSAQHTHSTPHPSSSWPSRYKSIGVLEPCQKAAKHFTHFGCKHANLPSTSPLESLLSAGEAILPHLQSLLKPPLTSSPSETDPFAAGEELPLEVDVPPEALVHSVVICPVTRLRATNDCKLLQCGHVVSAEALDGMARTRSTRSVECPVCGSSVSVDSAKPLLIS